MRKPATGTCVTVATPIGGGLLSSLAFANLGYTISIFLDVEVLCKDVVDVMRAIKHRGKA